MKATLPAALFIGLVLLNSAARGQPAETSLDKYLETAKTILIVKCLAVGPVNILLRTDVRVEVLLVVKGKEERREITVLSQYGMTPGIRYLLRFEDAAGPNVRYFARSRDSVIEVSDSEEVDILKTLSPRIVVLRTMNLRVYRLESEIRSLTYEMDALKTARRGK